MLFNSYTFIFLFLPAALVGFFVAGVIGRTAGMIWLVLCSLFFYACWNVNFLPFLLVSIAFNFGVSRLIQAQEARPRAQSWLLAFGIAGNLLALGFFKYLVTVVYTFIPSGSSAFLDSIVLPLGISFFTFTQIGYLIDTKQGVGQHRGLASYSLFVTFFPHLIAGPILRNREIIPQFDEHSIYRPSFDNLSVGLTIFAIGLLKKCILADPNAAIVDTAFSHPENIQMLSAWNAALSYQFQLYFDFSGYSDMAIGLARMFNLRFPANFDSPFKAKSPIDFWQRWHMTLTRYLFLYLFGPIALAVSRWRAARGLGTTRKAQRTFGGFGSMIALPMLITMGLAGVWHGAGPQYVIFGLLHGLYLCANHAWRIAFPPPRESPSTESFSVTTIKVCLTFLATLVAVIFFRAGSAQSGWDLVKALAGVNGLETISIEINAVRQIAWLAALFFIVWAMPNTQQIMRHVEPILGTVSPPPTISFSWRPNLAWAIVVGLGMGITMGIFAFQPKVEFLYTQF